jgi:hypothetical protein
MKIWSEYHMERDDFEDVNTGRRIILKCVLIKYDVRMKA